MSFRVPAVKLAKMDFIIGPHILVPDRVRIDLLAGPSKIMINNFGVLSMGTLYKYKH